MKLFCALALSAISLFADVTGKWSGSFDMTRNGKTKADTALLDLKQTGNKITGTAGPNADKQMPIRLGSIDGNTIKIEVDAEGDDPVIYISLVVDGDHMTGDAKAEKGDEKMSAKMDLKREK